MFIAREHENELQEVVLTRSEYSALSNYANLLCKMDLMPLPLHKIYFNDFDTTNHVEMALYISERKMMMFRFLITAEH